MALMLMLLSLTSPEGYSYDEFFYYIPIDVGKYYAISVATTSTNEQCGFLLGRTGGPITNNVIVQITCG